MFTPARYILQCGLPAKLLCALLYFYSNNYSCIKTTIYLKNIWNCLQKFLLKFGKWNEFADSNWTKFSLNNFHQSIFNWNAWRNILLKNKRFDNLPNHSTKINNLYQLCTLCKVQHIFDTFYYLKNFSTKYH